MQKRLLVTGAAGFIGSNFVRYLLEKRKQWNIVSLDCLTYAGNPANFEDLSPELSDRHRLLRGDIRDENLLERLFMEETFDGVVHLAAESHVDRSIYEPDRFVETNVLGTFRMLESSRRAWESGKVGENFRFLHVSTDEVYGSLGQDGYFTEKTPYDPSSPYSASKAASDHFVRAYNRTYGLPAVITNCSNNYGPYQFPEKLIPLMILNILEEKPLPVYGDGSNVRDWLYVVDHCDALLSVFERGKPGQTYNIGGNEERTNLEIVHTLCDVMDSRLGRAGEHSGRRLIRFVADRPGHDKRYAIDASKINEQLAWRPKNEFKTAMEATVDWYLDHMGWVESIRSGDYLKWIEKNYGDRG